MQLFFQQNDRLTAGFLLIAAAGYDYENNPNGFHSFRKQWYQTTLANKPSILKAVTSSSLPPQEYIRLINPIMGNTAGDNGTFDDEVAQIWESEHASFEGWLQEPATQAAIAEHRTWAEPLEQTHAHELSTIEAVLLQTLGLEQTAIPHTAVHLNALESYCRGSNYPSQQVISLSLDFDNTPYWPALRHECIHRIVKPWCQAIAIPATTAPLHAGYRNDSLEQQFEEVVVVALSLLFWKDEPARNNTLRYYQDTGSPAIATAYTYFNQAMQKKGAVLQPHHLQVIADTLAAKATSLKT